MRRCNVLSPRHDLVSDRAGYRWRGADVGRALGAEEIAGRLYELGEGQRAHPYHFHHTAEEWLVVVAGSPTLRTPAGEQALREGDAVCFAAGPEGAHEVRGPGTVLLVSDNRSPDVVEYPERGLLRVGRAGTVVRRTDADLWEDG